MQNIPNADLYDAQRWADDAAAEAEAELAYQQMLDDATRYAAQAAADAEAEAAYADLDEAEAMDTDIF